MFRLRDVASLFVAGAALACGSAQWRGDPPEPEKPFDDEAADDDQPVTPCDGVLREAIGRPYCVKAPPEATDEKLLPVLLLLHGFGSTGERQARYFGFEDLPERRGFLLVKPNGEYAAKSRFRAWNAFSSCCSPDPAPNDVAYLDAVLADVATAFDVDPARVYIVGHSNGAFMAQRYACDRSAKIAAVVSLAGAVDPDACEPASPVAFAEVHGTTDRLIRWNGGRTVRAKTTYPGVETTVSFWAKADGCTGTRAPAAELDLVQELHDTAETGVERYAGCRPGADVELWTLHDVGHVPRFRKTAWGDAVSAFLFAHPKK